MASKASFALGLAVTVLSVSCADPGDGARLLVIAHRGASAVAPENTLAAFRAAVAAGADYVELDTRESADGTFYCLHDETVDRTTNAGALLGGQEIPVCRLADEQLDALDAGAWFDAEHAGERIPRLAKALAVIQVRARTLLERKAGSAESLARLLRAKNLIGRLIVQSFDWQFLAELHKLEPAQPLAVLGDKAFDAQRWAALPATGARIVAWKHTDLDADLIDRLHARGYQVFAWTVDEPADWQRLAAAGIDGIITNRPGELRAALRTGKLRRADNAAR